MKSSSNLITAEQTQTLSLDWDPTDFSGEAPADQPVADVEENDQPRLSATDFESLIVPTVELKERARNSNLAPAPAISQAGSAEADATAVEDDGLPLGAVRKWTPSEVHEVFNPSRAKTGEHPVSSGPSLEDVRLKLIQEAMGEADRIVIEAQNHAGDIIQKAQDSAVEIMESSQRQGWDQAHQETTPMIDAVHQMTKQVQTWSEELYANSQGIVFNLVQEIAKALFYDGMALDGDMLQNTFNRVLSNARALGDLRIYVNPADAANLSPYWREYQVAISGQQIEIIPSESINRGGCFVDGQLGTVDGRIETQYKAIMDALATSMKDQNTAV